jgi:hypothetical protein
MTLDVGALHCWCTNGAPSCIPNLSRPMNVPRDHPLHPRGERATYRQSPLLQPGLPSSFGAPAVAGSLVRCAMVRSCHLSSLSCEQCFTAFIIVDMRDNLCTGRRAAPVLRLWTASLCFVLIPLLLLVPWARRFARPKNSTAIAHYFTIDSDPFAVRKLCRGR